MYKTILRLVAAFAVVFWANNTVAQSRIAVELIQQGGPNVPIGWEVFTGINSASLAIQGAELIGTIGLDGVDGEKNNKAAITFWKPIQEPYIWANLVRCIDYFDDLMQATGSACSIPKSKE